jgi:hypothetical protein
MPKEIPGRVSRRWLLVQVVLTIVLAGCTGSAAGPAALATATLLPAASPTHQPATTAPPPSATLTRPAPTATLPAATPTKPATAGPTASPTPDPAVAVVLAYLNARLTADAEAVVPLVCKAWKSAAVTEAISFRSMNARLEDVACTANGSSGLYTLVGCTGKMVTTYGGESRDWDLSSFIYQTLPEDGEWKMCGYNNGG